MTFASGIFLFALAGAAGPLIIHLLNRRRYRIVEWAPIEFVLRAVRHRRRRVQLRDLLLLLLRTLAIVFFVLAMARPIWTTHAPDAYQGQPVHAILVIDNSLSMAYAPFDRSRLEIARDKASGLIRDLPAGSDVTVIPMCEQGNAWFAEVYDGKEDATEAVARIEVVDRAARLAVTLARLRRALKQPGTAPIKRTVILSDMQKRTWDNASAVKEIEALGELQYVAIRSEAEQAEANSWIESLGLRGGYAESGSPAVFDAVIRHEGPQGRRRVRAVLSVGSDAVGEQLIDLASGQEKQVSFDYTFRALGGIVNPAYVPVRLELESDRLPLDNRRYFVAPVFRRIPVLFVDQHGTFEQPDQNRYGETFPLRLLYNSRLGAARGANVPRPPLQPVTIDAINQKQLKDVRLVVVAGVSAPTPEAVSLLRRFVEEGGELLITAGADFDPSQWTSVAWNQGAGILPTALMPEPLGALPKPGTARTKTFGLDVASLSRDLFNLRISESEWETVAGAPFFYRAVRVRHGLTRGTSEKRDTEGPSQVGSRVVGRYDNGEPFVIHRRIGKGNVIFVTTSCYPNWNNLAVAPEGGILLYDQMMQWLLGQSIPSHTFVEQRELVLPVDRRDQGARFQLASKNESRRESLAVEAVGSDKFAVVARGIDRRDILEVQRLRGASDPGDKQPQPLFTFAVNGPTEESSLLPVTPETLRQDGTHWLNADEPISLAGGDSVQRDIWWYLLALAIVCLMAEMVVASNLLGRRRQRSEVSP